MTRILHTSSGGQQASSQDTPLAVLPTEDFDISGKGDAAQWTTTDWINIEKRNGPAEYSTRAKLLYSSTGFYVLFSCEDTKITASLQEDSADLWTEDVVELFLWTDESVPLYFEYEISPLNHELVLLIPNLQGKYLGWIPWKYEGERRVRHAVEIVRDNEGNPLRWIAEFFVPYALFNPLQNVPPVKGTVWRMNLYRNDYDDGFTSWAWKPIESHYHEYERFGRIVFQ